jgi:hypothetical protein
MEMSATQLSGRNTRDHAEIVSYPSDKNQNCDVGLLDFILMGHTKAMLGILGAGRVILASEWACMSPLKW